MNEYCATCRRKKKKWIAGLLAFLIPGTGHFYLGQMAKGIAVMLLMVFDICAIVVAATRLNDVMLIVLLSLLLPIIYFYSLFDAIQSTDTVNDRLHYASWAGPGSAAYGMPVRPPMPGAEGFLRGNNVPGIIVVGAAAFILIVAARLGIFHWPFSSAGSMAGSVLLIGAGIGLFFWERRTPRGRK